MNVRLTDVQQKVVDHDGGALLVLAGPGSGKTRVLTERVRRLLADPVDHFRILALTFTNKAANEMKDRLDDVPDIQRVFVGTLHSFCMEVLANRGKPVGVDGLPNIFESFEDRKHMLANAISNDSRLVSLLRNEGNAKQQQQALIRWLSRISELKNLLLLPEMVENEDEQLLYEAYDAELRASNALDYDDLMLLTYRLFEERPKVADFYRRQYRYICIDEAQDLNEAQYRLISSLCGQSYKDIMLVGDSKQAIYVWNGADPKYLQLFERDFSAKQIILSENFRCSKEVVSAAQRLDPSYTVEGQLPIVGSVQIVKYENEATEAEGVVDIITSLMLAGHSDIEGDITLASCAVLGRNRFVFNEIEQKLKSRDIAHYAKLSAAPYQSESEVMKQLELVLRLLSNPRDRLHLAYLAKLWGVTETFVKGLPNDIYSEPLELIRLLMENATGGCAQQVGRALDAMQWTQRECKFTQALSAIESCYSTSGDQVRAMVEQDTNEWRKLWDCFVRSETGGAQSINAFLGQVALGAAQQPTEDGLALLTVHASKGTEFDVVFIIGMNEGTFPDYRAKGRSFDEERRSAFVAVTRSRRLLYVTYPMKKMMPWGEVKVQKPSQFIALMSPNGVSDDY